VALDFLTPTDFDAGPAAADVVEILADEEKRFADYEVLEELGRGGMGVVYRARQLSLGREVAMKFLLHGVLAGDAALARFRVEAEAVAGLRHPNIVTIYEIGEARGRPFFSMELVRGRTLSELLREGPWAASRAAGCLRRVAEALHYAHERGVLHRDLKPANVLIDEGGEPRVTDFGLAKRLTDSQVPAQESSPLTLSGQVIGTPAYISPEQAGAIHHALDARSDVYSLGALLYHLIAGRPPFVGESPSNILRQVAETEPISPRLLNPAVPRDLETVCLKCLEKDPSRRYVTAAELAEDLGRFLRDEPIRARPVSAAERAWRWCKRRPALAAAIAGMALLLGGIAVVSSTAARRIEGLRLDALTNLYASDMRLAQQAIAESKFGSAAELLERHRPRPGEPDLRGFEWRHFQARCRGAETVSLGAHSNQVQRVAFSPDGRLFATAAVDVQVWELATRRRVLHLPVGDFVWALAFSPDSRELFAADSGGRVLRFDLGESAPTRLLGTLHHRQGRPIALFWPADEAARHLRIVLHNGLLAWDGASPQAEPLATFETAFSRAQVTPDGGLAAVIPGPKLISVWRLNPPSSVKDFALPGIARAAAISPDGQRIAAGDFSGALRIFDLKTGIVTNVLTAHRGLIECAVFSPEGARLASAGADQIIRVHDAATGVRLGEWPGHRATIFALAFSPDGRWLVSGDKLGAVKLWDLSVPPRSSSGTVGQGFQLSTDGARVVSWSGATSVVVRSSSLLDEPGQTHPAPSNSWLFLSATSVAAIDPPGKLHRLETNGAWREVSLGGLTVKQGGALSPDGRFAALRVKEFPGPVIWDFTAGREVVRVENEPTWLSPVFDARSRRLAYSLPSGRVRIWELPSGREAAHFLAHRNYAYACDLSPDGQRLATAGFDGRVKLWEIEGRRLLGEYRSTADAYWTVALSPDGRRIAAGTSESSIVLWDVPSRQEVATFQLGGALGPVEGMLRFTPDGAALLHANGVLNQWAAPMPAAPVR
jgi:predicted Ser/Thr protein kinase